MSEALVQTARTLVAPEKGILAADESTGTIGMRFDQIGIASTEENRRLYRQMLLTVPGLGEHISGVILYDETIRQATQDGTPFTEVLRAADIIPGIKVDIGAKLLAGFPGEAVTEGLDGLRERFEEYRGLGARFAKWRATISIDTQRDLPTEFAILANEHAMARYAALSQEADVVPIVEPEVLMKGDHGLEDCAAATSRTLQVLYAQLEAHRVQLPGTLLKVNMVVPGADSPNQVPDETVAEATIAMLTECVPADVPGIVFLSGGMSDEAATNRLNEMNKRGPLPWELSFSYGRALQQPALKAWAGEAANVGVGQAALAHRARMNGLARAGRYSPDLESAA